MFLPKSLHAIAIVPLLLIGSVQAQPIFERPWGVDFTRAVSAQGEQLTVAALYCDSAAIYLYDLADRSLVSFVPADSSLTRTPLASIGRNTYVGDDFVVRDSEAIFLNSVDRRLEIFDLRSGSHLAAIPLDQRPLAKVASRKERIINRIYRDGDRIFLGNSRRVFSLEPSLAKAAAGTQLKLAPVDRRFVLYSANAALTQANDGALYWQQRRLKPVNCATPLSGKRYAVWRGEPIAVQVDAQGVRVEVVR